MSEEAASYEVEKPRKFFDEHWNVQDKDKTDGVSSGRGWVILWDSDETDPPFQFAVTRYVIGAVIGRIRFYQDGKFGCAENKEALDHLCVAAQILGGLAGCLPPGKREHWLDKNGNPAGGFSCGEGYLISWQNGPLGKIGSPERKAPNGAFVEDIIEAIASRLRRISHLYKNPKVVKSALHHLLCANEALDSRTKRRMAAKTEGTHEGN